MGHGSRRTNESTTAFGLCDAWPTGASGATLNIVGAGDMEPALRASDLESESGRDGAFFGAARKRRRMPAARGSLLLHASPARVAGLNITQANGKGTPAVVHPAGPIEATVQDQTGALRTRMPGGTADAVQRASKRRRIISGIDVTWAARSFTGAAPPKACDWLDARPARRAVLLRSLTALCTVGVRTMRVRPRTAGSRQCCRSGVS